MDQIIKLLKSYQATGSIKGVYRQYRVSKLDFSLFVTSQAAASVSKASR